MSVDLVRSKPCPIASACAAASLDRLRYYLTDPWVLTASLSMRIAAGQRISVMHDILVGLTTDPDWSTREDCQLAASTFFQRTPRTRPSNYCGCSRRWVSIASYARGTATRDNGHRCSLHIYMTRTFTPPSCLRAQMKFSPPRPGCILVLCRTTSRP